MRGYNKIMLYFWLLVGTIMLVMITYLAITEGFKRWAGYYVFVVLAFGMYFMRRWMMRRMEKHQKFLNDEAQKDQDA